MTLLRVALAVPVHRLFDYLWLGTETPSVGQRVQVPFAHREQVGVIIEIGHESDLPPAQLKCALALLDDLPPLPVALLNLCRFVSTYYQAPLGEVILQALPAGLKRKSVTRRRLPRAAPCPSPIPAPELTREQEMVIAVIRCQGKGFSPFLLHGVTGSGKTEVYLRRMQDELAAGGQVLLLVPEINLTPQLEERVRRRFPHSRIVALHSDLTEAVRERHWRAAFTGEADIVLGTRLAVFTPMPRLGLIVVDEEHDPSFKQQDGIRYSGRDVAVFRAHDAQIPIILGSATPSLESWANVENGRYRLLQMKERAHHAARMPLMRLVDTRHCTLQEGFSEPLLQAMQERLEKKEQSLIFLNRRGYAPVLACPACGWISHCCRCAANLVLHWADRKLRCHHCGFESRVPHLCPTCGNQDIQPFGRGTQRLELFLQEHFPTARVLRVDRDSARSSKQWQSMLDCIHAGEADILVGTQMLAKGHDFPALTLVGVLGADAALFAADWRAPERLFSQLMQVAGRAGRAAQPGEVLIQTQYPQHELYRALAEHDYPGFAASQLAERRQAGFPPYTYQAVLRAQAPDMRVALEFLAAASTLSVLAEHPEVVIYDPVPMRLSRLANSERAQLLSESGSRSALQAFLPCWRAAIETLRPPARLRWHLEVDPLEF